MTARHLGACLTLGGALSLLGGLIPVRAAETGGFELVDSMRVVRTNPAATLLQDGRVLVTGGRTGATSFASLASAEIFDPETNTFVRLSRPMNSPRWVHTATRLQDGRVLITGGFSGSIPNYRRLASAEVFDPATGVFSRVGTMQRARIAHTATLLPDGRVLVVGGADQNGLVKTAELFDPATGEFQKAGDLAVERVSHNAVALPDGRVVILGGNIPVEIYDPASGAFTTHGELTEMRGMSAAALLPDGRILIAGGSVWETRDDGRTRGSALRSIEIYDPATGQSAIVGTLTIRRSHLQSAILDNGQVLIAGGHSQVGSPWNPLRSAELIDPATGSAVRIDSMSRPRAEAASVQLQDGRILILGGFTTNLGVLRTAETYVP